MDRLYERGGRRLTGVRRHQGLHAASIEALEGQALEQPVAPQIRQQLGERIVGGDL
jgi:hypothetical protein